MFYHDAAGFTCYAADYCNSISHALDLAKANGVGLTPTEQGWSAHLIENPTVAANDTLPSKAQFVFV